MLLEQRNTEIKINIDGNNPSRQSSRKHDLTHISVRYGKQVSSTSECFDRVKLSRLKYLHLQANKCLSEFFKWLASLFTVMESLIFEILIQWNIISWVKMVWLWYEYRVLGTYNSRVNRMNMQVRLQNSLFHLAGRINTETHSRNTVLSKMSYLLFISWIRTRCFESHYLSKYVITCRSNMAFCVDNGTRRDLTVVWHRHPTERK